MYQRRGGVPRMGTMLLAYQVFGVIGIDRIPPVTLIIVGLQSAIYLRLFHLPWYNASDACISLYNIWHRRDYKRLLYHAFEHGDDWHLYYNMASFIVKGQALERRFGSPKFLYLTSSFTVLTSITYVGLCLLAKEFDSGYGNQCAIGFSGVIFALKVLTSYYYPNYSNHIMGIPVLIPANYAVWVELVVIQMISPNVSFLGHLAGILVGLAYVKGPLGPVLDNIYSLFTNFIHPPPPRFVPHNERSGYRESPRFVPHSEEPHGYREQFVPTGLSEEEQIRQAMDASLQDYSRNSPLSAEDLRRRRINHFQ